MSDNVTADGVVSRIDASSQKRPKDQLACDPCRRKKVRCDRQRPCGRCARLYPGDCIYHPSATSFPAKRPRRDAANLNVRIDRLERLVTEIAAPAPAPKVTTTLEKGVRADSELSGDVYDNSPQMRSDGDGTRFVQASHWETVLDEIAGIRNELYGVDDSRYNATPIKHSRSLLLLSFCSNISTPELICNVPSRQSVEALTDILVHEADFPSSCLAVIHIPTFRRECEAFWQNPSAVSLSWLALLYAVMCLGLQIALRSGIPPPQIVLPESAVGLYATRAAQCLIKSDYTKPTPHTIQAMILHLAAEHTENAGGAFGARLVFSIAIQQAYRLGFHREPTQSTDAPSLESEMRRRIWAFIVQMDLLISERCGLPRVIDDRQTDTKEPMDLHDEDLEPGAILPPSIGRDMEPTRVSYTTFRMKALKVQGKIFDRINSPQAILYEDVLELDRNLSDIAKARPGWLAPPDRPDDEPNQTSWVFKRIEVDLIINRAQMVLHRGYLLPARFQPSYAYSRNVCLEAARRVLRHQSTLSGRNVDDAGRQGAWRFASLVSHDFLLADMIICLNLDHDLRSKGQGSLVQGSETLEDVEVLRQSLLDWTNYQKWDDSAVKGASIVGAMLERVRRVEKPVETTALSTTRPEQSAFSDFQAMVPQNTSDALTNVDYPNGYVANLATNSVVQTSSGVGTDASYGIAESTQFDANVFDTMWNSSQTDFDWMAWDAQYPRNVFNF